MFLGLDGVEIGLIIVLFCLFGGILSGFPVAFAIAGAGVISFGIIAALDSAGLLIHQAIDTGSEAYNALLAQGVHRDAISVFRYPDLPRVAEAVFPGGWEMAVNRNLSFIVNRMNERVFAGQSIETLLAVLMWCDVGLIEACCDAVERAVLGMRVEAARTAWTSGDGMAARGFWQ